MTDHTPLTEQQLTAIEARATHERVTPGPWKLDKEGCDCGDDYPCGHGMYVTGVVTPTPTWSAAERCKRTGEQPRDYDFHRSDIGDFTDADWELMAHAREDVPALLAEVRQLRAALVTAQADTLGEVATELEGIDFHPAAKSDARGLCQLLAGRFRRKALERLDAARTGAQPATDRTRALALLEAANFLRDAHFRDGLTVQEIGTALRHTADEADPMVGSLARDGFGLDEIASTLSRPAGASR